MRVERLFKLFLRLPSSDNFLYLFLGWSGLNSPKRYGQLV